MWIPFKQWREVQEDMRSARATEAAALREVVSVALDMGRQMGTAALEQNRATQEALLKQNAQVLDRFMACIDRLVEYQNQDRDGVNLRILAEDRRKAEDEANAERLAADMEKADQTYAEAVRESFRAKGGAVTDPDLVPALTDV